MESEVPVQDLDGMPGHRIQVAGARQDESVTETRFDIATAMSNGLVDAAGVQLLIKDFTSQWIGRPLTGEDGVPVEELAAAGRQLGVPIPATLARGFSLFGRRYAAMTCQDPLLPAGGWRVDEELEPVLVFRAENQSCAYWGIRVPDLRCADPPVVVLRDRDPAWRPFFARLSLAWIEMVLTEEMFAAEGRYNACEIPPESAEVLDGYERLALPDYPFWYDDADSPIRWYATPGQLVRRDGLQPYSWVHVVGQTVKTTRRC